MDPHDNEKKMIDAILRLLAEDGSMVNENFYRQPPPGAPTYSGGQQQFSQFYEPRREPNVQYEYPPQTPQDVRQGMGWMHRNMPFVRPAPFVKRGAG